MWINKLLRKVIYATVSLVLLLTIFITYAPVSFFSDRAPFVNCAAIHSGKLRVSISYPDPVVKADESFQIRLFTRKHFDDKTGDSGPSIIISAQNLYRGSSVEKIVQDYSFERPERRFKVSTFNSLPAAEATYEISNSDRIQEYFVPTRGENIAIEFRDRDLPGTELAALADVLKTVRFIGTLTTASSPVVEKCSNWDWL